MHPVLRSLKAVMAVVVAVAAWLVTSPAWASVSAPDHARPENAARDAGWTAPQCDTRGATTFAPTPTLDPPNASIDIGDGDDADCLRLLGWSTYEQGRAPAPDCGCAVPDATLGAREPVTKAPFVGFVVGRASETTEHRGVRLQVERPPRG